MSILFILLFSFIAYITAIPYEVLFQEQWENFKLEYTKMYESENEEQYRRSIFMENLYKINEHNKLYHHGVASYKMAMNHFGDLLGDEFLRFYTIENASFFSDIKEDLPKSMQDFIVFVPPVTMNMTELPGDIDWRDKGAVTPVKNQGQCGACWSFSATGVLEGQWYRKTNKLVSLSEQNLMDCSWKYGNHGCKGGVTHEALNYVRDNKGIDTEDSYPYRGKNSKNCKYQAKSKGASITQVVILTKDENQLQIKVGSLGPMAVTIEVNKNFQFYHSGVFDDSNCGQSLNHAVLVVGYGSQSGKDYWLVKNSWGRGWGEKGYIRMARNKNNQCGIASEVSYPIV